MAVSANEMAPPIEAIQTWTHTANVPIVTDREMERALVLVGGYEMWSNDCS